MQLQHPGLVFVLVSVLVSLSLSVRCAIAQTLNGLAGHCVPAGLSRSGRPGRTKDTPDMSLAVSGPTARHTLHTHTHAHADTTKRRETTSPSPSPSPSPSSSSSSSFSSYSHPDGQQWPSGNTKTRKYYNLSFVSYCSSCNQHSRTLLKILYNSVYGMGSRRV